MKLRLPLFTPTSPIHLGFRIFTPLVEIDQTVLYHYSVPHSCFTPLCAVLPEEPGCRILDIGKRTETYAYLWSLNDTPAGFEDQTDSMKLHGFGHVQNGSSGANNCPFPLRLSNWRGSWDRGREGEGEKRVLDGVMETLDGKTEMLDGRTGTLDGRAGMLAGAPGETVASR